MTAKIYGTDSVQTLDEFEQQALRVAGAIGDEGIGPGDRVMLKAGNSAGYVATLLALMHIGASIVLVDQQEQVDATGMIARKAGVKLVIADEDAPLPAEENPVYLYELLAGAAGRGTYGRAIDVDGWCERPDGLIMWTSGSTGSPKGIVKSGGAFLTNLRRNADQVGHRSDDVLLPLLPFAHQYGLSMVLIAWLRRCSLVIAPYRRIDRALRMAGAAGVTVIDATPSTYRSILGIVRSRPRLREELAATRMFCVGAAPLDPPLVDEYVGEFGMPLLDSYGSTELGNVAFATIENPVATGQVMPGIAVRITGDDGEDRPAGEIGEIEIDTPDLMTGLLAEDGSVMPAPRGWWRTGDLGYLDHNDNLFVLGRKFAVHRMGYTLYPEIIERKLAAAGCAARIVPVPDERRGSQLICFVADEDSRDAAYWRDRQADILPAFERPNRVIVLDAFPLNRNGKPDKRQLEKLALEQYSAENTLEESGAPAPAGQPS